MKRYLAGALALCLGVSGAAASAAVAGKPRSQDEARAMGNPAGTAPVRGMPSQFSYNGRSIARDDAARKGLSCNQIEDEVTCYDSNAEADAATGQHSHGHASRSSGKKKKVRARASWHCEDSLNVFRDTYGQGWRLSLHSRQAWYNLTGDYDNRVSSFGMGNHSGHLSEYHGGGGYWFPDYTGVCAVYEYIGASAYNPSWDNRISSRYRN